jgi:NAD(P)-dependent dehydrogenase (short-subunit alcohol dehydrogenase family)
MEDPQNARKVVIITGASSGIGREAARLFAQKGWQVVATMRDTSRGKGLLDSGNVDLLRVDVRDSKSIRDAYDKTMKRYGRIDVLVNNAGYGLVGPIEAAKREQMEAEVDTNLIGLMDATALVLPHMRKNTSGTIVNISSMAGKVAFPYHSAYNATKFGVEGFTESVQYEVRRFGIGMKLVEPGMVETDFYTRSMEKLAHPAYGDYPGMMERTGSRKGIPPARVAEVIYRAATDRSNRLRYPVGSDAAMLLLIKKVLPDGVFSWLIMKVMKG